PKAEGVPRPTREIAHAPIVATEHARARPQRGATAVRALSATRRDSCKTFAGTQRRDTPYSNDASRPARATGRRATTIRQVHRFGLVPECGGRADSAARRVFSDFDHRKRAREADARDATTCVRREVPHPPGARALSLRP